MQRFNTRRVRSRDLQREYEQDLRNRGLLGEVGENGPETLSKADSGVGYSKDDVLIVLAVAGALVGFWWGVAAIVIALVLS